MPAGYRLDDQHSMSGNNVMFDAVHGKILTFGGQERYDGSFGTRNAHIITIDEPYKKAKVVLAGLNGSKSENHTGGMSISVSSTRLSFSLMDLSSSLAARSGASHSMKPTGISS